MKHSYTIIPEEVKGNGVFYVSRSGWGSPEGITCQADVGVLKHISGPSPVYEGQFEGGEKVEDGGRVP